MLFRLFLMCFVLSACTPALSEATPFVPTSTAMRVVQNTPVPTVSRQIQTVEASPSLLPSTAIATTEIVCPPTTGLPTTAHTISVELDYREQSAAVRQQIAYVNRTGEALAQIVLDVKPNGAPNLFTLHSLTVGDDIPLTTYELTGRRLNIDLPEPLQPDCPVILKLGFDLKIPPMGQGLAGYSGYFGFSSRQINLGHWLPVVVPYRGEWVLHETPSVGEQTVSDPADWDITLVVNGASEALVVAAPGTVSQPAAGTWRFQQANARDFAISMSERFNVASRQTEWGTFVEVYTFDDALQQTDTGLVDGAAHALDVATRSLSMYSDLFGAYPHERFLVVQGDFPDGMEFSDLVFVSSSWFQTYKGQPTSYLTIITVHEVAHQWWYARVGNDQAITPWMDESLATYSEYIFYEEYYPELREWWWQFRVNTFIPTGFDDRSVDSSVYEFTSVREYINAVYLRGARMLHDLRRDLGTEAFFEWLRLYAETGNGQLATPDLLWSLLTPEQLATIAATRNLYLKAQ